MAKLLKPPEEVKKAITTLILAGKDLAAKADVAESTGRYEDWLVIFAKWRDETAAELTTLYAEEDIGSDFTVVTGTGKYSSPRSTFPYAKTRLGDGNRDAISIEVNSPLGGEPDTHLPDPVPG